MKCLGFRQPSMALESYEKPAMRNAIHCPPGKYTKMAIGMLTAMAASTNGVIPLLPENGLLMPWLGINDALLGTLLTAALVTINTETAVDAVKERLSKPGQVIVDTREEILDDWTGRCDRCETSPPIRAFHCPYCQKCVTQFDHHCNILGVCIGKSNHRAFLTTIITTVLYLINTLAMCIAAICIVANLDFDDIMNKVGIMTSLVSMALFTLAPLSFLLRVISWQIRAAMEGLTQYEWFSMRSAKADILERLIEEKKQEKEEQAKADAIAKEQKAKSDADAKAEADAIVAYYASLASDVPEIVVVE